MDVLYGLSASFLSGESFAYADQTRHEGVLLSEAIEHFMNVCGRVRNNSPDQVAHWLLQGDRLLINVNRVRRWKKADRCMQVARISSFAVLLDHQAVYRTCLNYVFADCCEKCFHIFHLNKFIILLGFRHDMLIS